jgi:hypothetical protein
LGGLGFLILATAAVWAAGGVVYGLLLFTEFWIALCLAVGLILLLASAVLRLARRLVS